MEDSAAYHIALEHSLLDLLGRVVPRAHTTPLDPPVPLELVQPDFEKFRNHSVQKIEQAARSCVYRIAVNKTLFQYLLMFLELDW